MEIAVRTLLHGRILAKFEDLSFVHVGGELLRFLEMFSHIFGLSLRFVSCCSTVERSMPGHQSVVHGVVPSFSGTL